MKKLGKWSRVLYSLSLFSVGFLVLLLICPDSIDNNTFWYFSIINQIACYSLGFVIYDIWKNEQFDKISIPWVKCVFAFVVGAIVFYSKWIIAPLLIPVLFGITGMYLIIALLKRRGETLSDNLILKALKKIGSLSFSIYLTHLFAVYYLTKVIKHLIGSIIISEIGMFFIILPIVIICVYVTAVIFNKIIKMIESIIYCKIIRSPNK